MYAYTLTHFFFFPNPNKEHSRVIGAWKRKKTRSCRTYRSRKCPRQTLLYSPSQNYDIKCPFYIGQPLTRPDTNDFVLQIQVREKWHTDYRHERLDVTARGKTERRGSGPLQSVRAQEVGPSDFGSGYVDTSSERKLRNGNSSDANGLP